MSEDCGGELLALHAVIEACRVQASALDMPALAYLLDRAATALAAHVAEDGPSCPLDGGAGASSAPH